MNDTTKVKVRPTGAYDSSRKPSLMIATPMYGGLCTATYVQGLLLTMDRMRQIGVNVAWCQISNESLITRARNEIARVFLDSGNDYLMFVDADIGFDGEAIAQLLLADKEVVCGIYPKKEVNWDSVKRAAVSGKSDLEDYAGAFVFNVAGAEALQPDGTGCIPVRHGGTGFMLIKREVFERLKPHVPTYRVSSFRDEAGEYVKPLTHEFFATSIDETGALLSEDYHFCELMRKHGGEVFAHPFIHLTHTGTYVFDGDIFKSGGNLK